MNTESPALLQLQQQIHEATQSRLEAIEAEQAESRARQLAQASTLSRIEQNTDALTEALPGLVGRVAELEKTDNRHRGALGVLSFLWAALLAFIEVKTR